MHKGVLDHGTDTWEGLLSSAVWSAFVCVLVWGVFNVAKIIMPIAALFLCALTISLALRFIPTIFIESDKVIKSQISRGLNLSGNISEKCDKIISVIFPIFDLSLKRGEEISNVLEMRLYKVGGKRSKYKNNSITIIDVFSLLLHIILILIFIVLEVVL